MRLLLAIAARRLLRHEQGSEQGSHLLPLIWPDLGDQVQHTTDDMLPEELHGAPSQVCPVTMLSERESAWVRECFKADSKDSGLYKKLHPWVNFRYSTITKSGAAAICVAAVPCQDAITSYLSAFEDEGCKHNPAQKPGYLLAQRLKQAATLCARFGDSAAEGVQSPQVDGNKAGGKLSLQGCYHDYPACAKDGGSCLEFPVDGAGSSHLIGAQKVNELYFVSGSCYMAKASCVGCLYDPAGNPEDLQPWDCPELKCADKAAFAAADSPGPPDQAQCEPKCLGHPACGHDGCGGSCGVCHEQEECNKGSCVYRPFKNRFKPRARYGSDAPPKWFTDFEDNNFVKQRMEARDKARNDMVFRDWLPNTGRQGLGKSTLDRVDGYTVRPGSGTGSLDGLNDFQFAGAPGATAR